MNFYSQIFLSYVSCSNSSLVISGGYVHCLGFSEHKREWVSLTRRVSNLFIFWGDVSFGYMYAIFYSSKISYVFKFRFYKFVNILSLLYHTYIVAQLFVEGKNGNKIYILCPQARHEIKVSEY